MRRTLAALALAIFFSAPTSASEPLDLTPWKGKVVLVDFWASWCAPCRQSFPWMEQMRAKYGDRGLVVIAVGLDQEPEAATAFLAGSKADFVHRADPEGALAESYGVRVMPSSILFDREGRPVYRHEGFRAADAETYERHLVDVLEGRAPQTPLALGPAPRSRLGVHPWQRGLLADPAMERIGDPLEAEVDDHIYFSKEASSGGRGFGGGGCGCN